MHFPGILFKRFCNQLSFNITAMSILIHISKRRKNGSFYSITVDHFDLGSVIKIINHIRAIGFSAKSGLVPHFPVETSCSIHINHQNSVGIWLINERNFRNTVQICSFNIQIINSVLQRYFNLIRKIGNIHRIPVRVGKLGIMGTLRKIQ